MARDTRRESKREIRDQQRAWLRRVLEAMKTTPTELARAAGMADVTLSRFLNRDDYEGVLSALTLRLLVEHTGLPGPDDMGGNNGSKFGFSDGAQVDYRGAEYKASPLGKLLALALHNRPNAAPWLLNTHALETAGYLQGDIVIVDAGVAPRAHDAVCAQVLDHAGGAETVFRIFEPPVLTGANLNVGARPRPLLVDGTQVSIAGVVTDLFRTRRE